MAVSRSLPWTYAVEHHMKTQLQCETDLLCFHLTLRETQTPCRGGHISGVSAICPNPQRANQVSRLQASYLEMSLVFLGPSEAVYWTDQFFYQDHTECQF